jgi:hypothetical protein
MPEDDEDGMLDFSYSIAGYVEDQEFDGYTEESSELESLVLAPEFASGLSFAYSIAGYQTQEFDGRGITTPESERIIDGIYEFDGYTRETPQLLPAFRLKREFDGYTTSSPELETEYNVGFTDRVMFGDVTLSNAKYPEGDFIQHDGSISIQVNQITGFYGNFICETTDYNEIDALSSMVGKAYTLRVWGRPYRNCKIMTPFEERSRKQGVSRFVYKIIFKQDTSVVTRST